MIEQPENTVEILAEKVGNDSTRNSNIGEISLGSFEAGEEKFIAEHCSIFEKIIRARTREFLSPLFPSLPRREASRKRASIFPTKIRKIERGMSAGEMG